MFWLPAFDWNLDGMFGTVSILCGWNWYGMGQFTGGTNWSK
jgi:hypothetical protein